MDGPPEISTPAVGTLDLELRVETLPDHLWQRPLQPGVREARLLGIPPWVRSLGKLAMEVKTEGWRFPTPPKEIEAVQSRVFFSKEGVGERETASKAKQREPTTNTRRLTRLKPPADAVILKDRLLYLLQPPLESLF